MINLYHAYKPIGKVVYLVDLQRFYNTSSADKDGKIKALNYCKENNINPDKIIKFDSDLECDRYIDLLMAETEKKITNLRHHEVLELIPSFFNSNGDLIPAITYNCDFIYEYNGKTIYEDVKGASLLMDTRFEVLKAIFDYQNKNNDKYIKIVIRRENKWKEWKIGERKKDLTGKQKKAKRLKEIKKELHDKEIETNKINRVKTTYLKYKDLPKLNSNQKKKFNEYETFLKEKGIIL